jgi:3-hydroxyisobutyrate dehydrogenase
MTDRSAPSLGYVGLGNMGGPLAARLRLTRTLHVFDLNPAAVRRLTAHGALACASPRDLAERCDIILLCLPASDHVHAVIFGPDGLAAAAKPGTLIIDQTTADPAKTRVMAAELAQRGLELIDAPVSGGPQGAEQGTVAIMVGATPEQYARAEPILRALSPNLFHAGAVGAGHVAKLANNLLSAAHRAITVEALALAAKNGVQPAVMVDILLAGSGRNFFLERFVRSSIVTGKLATGFTLNFMHKDVALATQLGVQSGVPMFCGNTVREFFQVCINMMGRETEANTIALVMDQLAGTQVVPADYTLT